MVQLIRELIEGGFVGQAIIATILVGTVAIVVIRGGTVPEWLIALTSGVVAWFFRSQAQVIADSKKAKAGRKSPVDIGLR